MKKFALFGLMAIAVVSLLITPADAQKDKTRNKVEKAKERQDLRQNAWAARDDALDLAKLRVLRAEFAQARLEGDQRALAVVDQKVMKMLARERVETRKETAAARKEVRESRREVRSDRREIRENRKEGVAKRVKRDDRRELREDRRETWEDKRQK